MKTTKNTTWNQKINSSKQLKGDINYIFNSAIEKHTTHKNIINSIKEGVYNNQKYISLPNYMRSEINGYIEAKFDSMSFFVEWSHWYNGKFVGKNIPYGNNFNQELVESNFVYKGSTNIY